MRIASIVSAAALLALATAGSALAAEPFATLDGVTAETLSPAELAQVQGSHLEVVVDGGTPFFLGNERMRKHALVTVEEGEIVSIEFIGSH